MLDLVTVSDPNLCSSAVVGTGVDLNSSLSLSSLRSYDGFQTCFEVSGLQQRPTEAPTINAQSVYLSNKKIYDFLLPVATLNMNISPF